MNIGHSMRPLKNNYILMKEYINNWKLWLIASLTLGLAPFVPEPHLFGKIQWIMGGAKGMQLLDWFDFIQHGFPFILLARALIVTFVLKK
jgi:hypothetical protein